eukprot:6830133-Prymnesium_polylepis.1
MDAGAISSDAGLGDSADDFHVVRNDEGSSWIVPVPSMHSDAAGMDLTALLSQGDEWWEQPYDPSDEPQLFLTLRDPAAADMVLSRSGRDEFWQQPAVHDVASYGADRRGWVERW